MAGTITGAGGGFVDMTTRETRSRIVATMGLAAMLLIFGATGCSDDDSGTNDNTNNNTNNSNNNNQGIQCPEGFDLSPSGKACGSSSITETTRTQCGDIWENCDDSATLTPNLACIGQPVTPPSNPPTVTLTGFVDVFSSGGNDVDGVTVQVYRQSDVADNADLDSITPVAQTTLSIDQQMVDDGQVRACFANTDDIANEQMECPQPTDDCNPPCQDSLDGNEFCYQAQCYDRLRYEVRYRVENVPTYEFLVVRTMGPGGVSDPKWGVMVHYNLYFQTTDDNYDEQTNTYERKADLISRQDWLQIPTVMGLPNGVSPGKGAVAGEVHDCDGIRLSGAQVYLYPVSQYLSYFNGNPVDTLPLLTQFSHGTNRLGLFAAMNVDPGPVHVEAWGDVNNESTLLGELDVQVFPDSVTIVSINDGMPPME